MFREILRNLEFVSKKGMNLFENEDFFFSLLRRRLRGNVYAEEWFLHFSMHSSRAEIYHLFRGTRFKGKIGNAMPTFSFTATFRTFHRNSQMAMTNEPQHPIRRTKKTPPTLASPSSLEFAGSTSPLEHNPPPRSSHHFFFRSCSTPFSCSISIAPLMGVLYGESARRFASLVFQQENIGESRAVPTNRLCQPIETKFFLSVSSIC